MKSSRVSSLLWSTAVPLLAAMLLLPSEAAGAAKGAAKNKAKSAAAKAKSDSGSSSSASSSAKPSTPYEVPGPAPSETAPSGSSTATSTGTATSTSISSSSSTSSDSASKPAEPSTPPAESTPTEAPKEAAPPAAPSGPILSQETTVPPVEDITPPTEPPPPYVQHLGPDSYPGKLRGIYGGSLWLEPSFHGLQWPYMPKTGVGVSGLFWVDSGWQNITRDDKDTPIPDTTMTLQQGRALLRVTPTYTNGKFFIQSQVELVGNMCQGTTGSCITNGTFSTDDLWVRFGKWGSWDLKVGRFEGWEMYHLGMGMDLYTLERLGAHNRGIQLLDENNPNRPPAGMDAPDFYGLNWMHNRPTDGLGVGYMAFHAYPGETVRFELLGKLGATDITRDGYSYMGARPSVILDYGWLKLKGGAEYEKRTGVQSYVNVDNNTKSGSKASRTRIGFGGSVLFVIDPRAEFGGSIAMGTQKSNEDFESGAEIKTESFSRNTVGGFANLRLGALWLVGGGVHYTWQNDKYYEGSAASPNYTAQLQTFGAIQYLLARQLYIKAVFSYARTDFVPSNDDIPLWNNYMMSGRVRLMYVY